MTIPFRTLICSALMFTAVATNAHALFDDANTGVRPEGMGEAFVAVSDDANAGLHNPAGFARVPSLELTGMYADLYSQLNAKLYTGETDRLGYNFAALALPPLGDIGHAAFTWNQFYSTLYQENAYTLSFARGLLDAGRLDAGVSVKAFGWQVASTEITAGFPDRQRNGVTADLGFLSSVTPDLTLGLALQNIIPVDLGLNDRETVPAIYRLGAAYRFAWVGVPMSSLLVATEFTARTGVYNAKLGGEARFFQKLLAVRAGVNADAVTAGLGVDYGWPESPLGLRIDYAFAYPFQVSDTFGSHRVGLTASWNPQPAAPEKRVALPVEDAGLQAKIKSLEAQKQALEGKLRQLQEDIEIGALKPIWFETGKSILLASAFGTLDYLGKVLEHYPELVVRIEGHTDDVGSDAYNLTLSQDRAQAVCEYLAGRYPGIRPDHLIGIGYGKTRPVTTASDEAGRAKNRRVEFVVINPYVTK